MKILALDTATASCSVAITDERRTYAELTTRKNQTHSKHLMQMIDSVLESAGLHIDDLGGFALTIGPGSFTGLRIGISTIKGLALATDKPVVGISSLETLAWQCAHRNILISPLLDARKAEIYGATYRFIDNCLVEQTPAMASAPEAFIRKIKEPCIFVGCGAQLYRQTIEKSMGPNAHFMPDDQNLIKASSIAFLSMNRFKTSDTDGVADLVPRYIRKSDAELSVAARPQIKSPKNNF
ncbi:MAG: tRNA (adenosine(37)-N6)-threonylcarbamoyltransferase complex dimerization subunit type 1 TsaB [Desulfobacterales bacterium]|nr:tRNA (adenosine(37)-N6)-threonylcarbamoyltransferase complex dimerization subunit type 1 TsaB [Desulfobacterales bacterium]